MNPEALIARQHGPHPVSMMSTAELSRRPSRPRDHAAENRALVALAQDMAASPDGILQKLADTALILCRAHSAGLSLLEDEDQQRNFHWRAIAGQWASHAGGGTPRDFGPCGTVLDRNEALMCSHPERDFPYFGEVTPLLEEALLIPFYVDGEARGTIWVVAHDESRRFDAEDLRVMTSLGTFAAAAYQTRLSLETANKANQELLQSASLMQRNISERELAQEQQSLLLREMSHRIKNLFAVASGLVGLSAHSARTPQEMAAAVQERLAALTRAHELTRPGLIDLEAKAGQDTTLHALIRTIFAPYVGGRSKGREGIILTGPNLPIGENAITSFALVLHELATNAAKYGALSTPGGVIHVDCSIDKDELLLTWREHGGPALDGPPADEGFGGMLTRRIVTQQFGGQLSKEWRPDGLALRLSLPIEGLATPTA